MSAVGSTQLAQNPKVSNPAGLQAPLVKLSLIVTDDSNHSLDEIRKEDIKVFEDKAEQAILLLEKADGAIDYCLMIDTSASFEGVLGSAHDAAAAIIESNRADDKIFLASFTSSDAIFKVEDFTSDKSLLLASMKLLTTQAGRSAVIDAVYVAIDHTAEHARKERRPAIVLITDGEDRSSYYGKSDLVKRLRETRVQVFIIGIVTKLETSSLTGAASPREKAENLLRTIAEESGGRLFLPKNVNELAKATSEIIHDLHSQFVIGYQPVNNSRKSGFRKVEVKLVDALKTERRKLIAPRGYYLIVKP